MTFSKDHPVFLAVRERLLLGHWKQGTKLVAGDLADDLGVSVSPVRDALIRLTERGVVSNVDKIGFTTSSFDAITTVHYCELLGRFYVDSVRTIATAALLGHVAEHFAQEAKLIRTDINHPGQRCLQYISLFRRALLAKPYRTIVERIGDIVFAHVAVTVGSDRYYQGLAAELVELATSCACLVGNDTRQINHLLEQYFTSRAAEIKRAAAQRSVLQALTG